jgi:hypothetical protein
MSQRRRGLSRDRQCLAPGEALAKEEGAGCVVISAKIEAEIACCRAERRVSPPSA